MLKKTLIVLYLTMLAWGIWWTRDVDSETGRPTHCARENTPVEGYGQYCYLAPENTPGYNPDASPAPEATRPTCYEDAPCWGTRPRGDDSKR